MSDSKTPITDAAVEDVIIKEEGDEGTLTAEYVPVETARQLERELAEEREGHAFDLTLEMVQARNDQLANENERLKAELADLRARVDRPLLERKCDSCRWDQTRDHNCMVCSGSSRWTPKVEMKPHEEARCIWRRETLDLGYVYFPSCGGEYACSASDICPKCGRKVEVK